MKIQPVVIISPWLWLVITFWKPLLVAFLVFVVLFYAMLPVAYTVALESARKPNPTMYIPQTWRDSLTAAARP